jgi:hypothetical protein
MEQKIDDLETRIEEHVCALGGARKRDDEAKEDTACNFY